MGSGTYTVPSPYWGKVSDAVQVGEGFVRELDFSRIWLRINANDASNDRDDIVAEFKCDTKDFLEQCYVSKRYRENDRAELIRAEPTCRLRALAGGR